MDSEEIENILSKHCPETFGGVFAADNYTISRIPCFIVLNTDTAGKSGRHWITMFINPEMSEFFDSLGQSPAFYHKSWNILLQKFSLEYMFNAVRIQEADSALCGEYCIYYIMMRNAGIEFMSILDMANSSVVKKFVERLS